MDRMCWQFCSYSFDESWQWITLSGKMDVQDAPSLCSEPESDGKTPSSLPWTESLVVE